MYNGKFQIFLSGGISGLNYADAASWRNWVKSGVIENLKIAGRDVGSVRFFNPVEFVENDEFQEREDCEREMMDLDLFNLRHSDLVIVNFNDPDSIGTAMEVSMARDRDIPIIGHLPKIKATTKNLYGVDCDVDMQLFIDDLHPWLQNSVSKWFSNDFESLAEYVVYTYLL